MIAGFVPPGAPSTTRFFSWFESFDRAEFYILLHAPGAMHVQHFTIVKFKSDGAVVGLIDAMVIKFPDGPGDLDTDHPQGETDFVPPFSYIHSYGCSPSFPRQFACSRSPQLM